jgi:intracellular septation protein
MQLFYEVLPVFLFFLTFKFYDIYAATVVGIGATLVQVLATRIWTEKWDRKQLITLGVFVLFGGMTLYFHNPIFVKWKPTIIFWIFAIVIIGSQLFTRRPLMQRLMQNVLQDKGEVPAHIWTVLNIVWAIFFIVMGAINLYIAYYFSNDAWVNFKFYGVTSALFLLSVFQAFYLMRYISEPNK